MLRFDTGFDATPRFDTSGAENQWLPSTPLQVELWTRKPPQNYVVGVATRIATLAVTEAADTLLADGVVTTPSATDGLMDFSLAGGDNTGLLALLEDI